MSDCSLIGRQQSELLGRRLEGIPDHLPAQAVAAGPGQAAAAIQASASPVAKGRRELVISHGNLINWFVVRGHLPSSMRGTEYPMEARI